ncbi:TatD family hydrolase [Paraliobacillus sediminis]|uniref:TatD family hydrolase n=1 Tax=Paraliobacillus sediminis TaxID=1885916 RepID=UPI000E3C1E9A|nr:TatD family hydrolase [Paraliobacillus sediminis]
MFPIIDAHIHLDLYARTERLKILAEMDQAQVEALICVSNDVHSAEKVMELARRDTRVKPAIGFHPEQFLPTTTEMKMILSQIKQYQHDIIAIGEVGLPYYKRQKEPSLDYGPYVELLEQFIKQAARLDKPIVLHAVYDDAPIVCDLLEKHNLINAHFHWFKGDQQTITRMIDNGYFISITPDCLYEEEIQTIIKSYPLNQMMVETDGPWPFEGSISKEKTHPKMIHQSIEKIAELKQLPISEVYQVVYQNTKTFYRLEN